MILGDQRPVSGVTFTTLDELFRRAGIRDPDAPALTDPPNRSKFVDGPPRRLSYAEADRAISSLANRLRHIGLPTDSIVALQLPNTVESVIAFLAVLRAGMIAAPLPLLWRREEITAALGKIGAKAIVTFSRIASVPHARFAIEAAAEVFTIRQVCGFGPSLPDGTVCLDDIFNVDQNEHFQTSIRPGSASAHLAGITFDTGVKGLVPLARNHSELITAGLTVFLECDAPPRENFLSTAPISSFAGLALTLMPWLLSGGSLQLHHGFDIDTFAVQSAALQGGVVVVPAAAVPAFLDAGFLNDPARTMVALWRRPERFGAARIASHATRLIDAVAFGDTAIIAACRTSDGKPAPIRHGAVTAPRGAIGAMTVLETARSETGTLLVRGPMVPMHPYPSVDEIGAEICDAHGYRDTGFACRLERETQTLVVTAPPPGLVGVGGYIFAQQTVEARVAAADAGAIIVALPDSILGQRLAGTAGDRNTLQAGLPATGVNPLISGAFRPRGAA